MFCKTTQAVATTFAGDYSLLLKHFSFWRRQPRSRKTPRKRDRYYKRGNAAATWKYAGD
jgi:hypothetical protein